jgi:hypothetical protein
MIDKWNLKAYCACNKKAVDKISNYNQNNSDDDGT